jgi:[ribosomal protein S5]-alanine N-acetyltransferase
MSFRHTTARLELRSFTRGDVEAAHRVYGDPEVMRFVGEGKPAADLEATLKMLDGYLAYERANGFSFWALVERESGMLVGDAGLMHLEYAGPGVELGYTLGRDWWGRGYATEAGLACAEIAFERFGLDEVFAMAARENAASIRVLEKIGMTRVGPRRAYGREHVLYRLARQDSEGRSAAD